MINSEAYQTLIKLLKNENPDEIEIEIMADVAEELGCDEKLLAKLHLINNGKLLKWNFQHLQYSYWAEGFDKLYRVPAGREEDLLMEISEQMERENIIYSLKEWAKTYSSC